MRENQCLSTKHRPDFHMKKAISTAMKDIITLHRYDVLLYNGKIIVIQSNMPFHPRIITGAPLEMIAMFQCLISFFFFFFFFFCLSQLAFGCFCD